MPRCTISTRGSTRPWHAACRRHHVLTSSRTRSRNPCKSAQRPAAAEHQPKTHSDTGLSRTRVVGRCRRRRCRRVGASFPRRNGRHQPSYLRSINLGCCLHVPPLLLPLLMAGAGRLWSASTSPLGRTGARGRWTVQVLSCWGVERSLPRHSTVTS